MALRLRPLAVPADLERVAQILTAIGPEPISVEELLDREKHVPASMIRHRVVAADEAGRVIGYGMTRHLPSDAAGQYFVRVLVDPARRGEGAGRLLAEALEQFAIAQGATAFVGDVRDDDGRSRAFAERRGYRELSHAFESVLRPADFDEARFAGVVESVAQSGIRFFTLAEALVAEGVSPTLSGRPLANAELKLFDLIWSTAVDDPDYDQLSAPPIEEWLRAILGRPGARPDLIFIAADGDRWVGYTMLQAARGNAGLLNGGTGVDRQYRGRKIALALKLLSIQAAKAVGASHLRTNNSSKNGPMLTINRKLGYVPTPGYFSMRRVL